MMTDDEILDNLYAQQPWVDDKYRQNRHVKTVNLRVYAPGVDYIDRR